MWVTLHSTSRRVPSCLRKDVPSCRSSRSGGNNSNKIEMKVVEAVEVFRGGWTLSNTIHPLWCSKMRWLPHSAQVKTHQTTFDPFVIVSNSEALSSILFDWHSKLCSRCVQQRQYWHGDGGSSQQSSGSSGFCCHHPSSTDGAGPAVDRLRFHRSRIGGQNYR